MMKRRSQRGATLIVVLVILLLIMIIGTLAIRQSLVSLNIATNSQAQQLMLESSDAAIVKVEDPIFFNFNRTGNGIFGYALDKSRKGKEIVFCFKGTQSNFFDNSQVSLMQWQDGATSPTGTAYGTAGYCSVSSSTNNYASGRQAVMTQVTVQAPDESETSSPFVNAVIGTDTLVAKLDDNQVILVHAISFMPTLSPASSTDINNCLSQKMSNPKSYGCRSIDKCNSNGL
jgi:Tfp pilus assembly protein PilX